MKSTVLSLAFCLVALALMIPVESAKAQPATPNPQTQIDNLKWRCDSVQSTIRRLHTTDGLLRVNIGQVYNDISFQLMAKLNGRLAVNRVDSAKLVEITNEFESGREEFSEAYNDYEESVASLLKLNCQKNTAEYYAQLMVARDMRQKLAVSVEELNDTVVDYQVAVEQLKEQIRLENHNKTSEPNEEGKE